MVEIIFQPKIFNYIIMGMYCANAIWWAFHGKHVATCYWLSALAITATVTFGYEE
jgi:hypothetical protein